VAHLDTVRNVEKTERLHRLELLLDVGVVLGIDFEQCEQLPDSVDERHVVGVDGTFPPNDTVDS